MAERRGNRTHPGRGHRPTAVLKTGPALMRYNDFITAEWHPVWWPARSSKPLLGGDPVLGGFDSHAAPPYFFCRDSLAYHPHRWSTRTSCRIPILRLDGSLPLLWSPRESFTPVSYTHLR